jgi:hypothetical protein
MVALVVEGETVGDAAQSRNVVSRVLDHQVAVEVSPRNVRPECFDDGGADCEVGNEMAE